MPNHTEWYTLGRAAARAWRARPLQACNECPVRPLSICSALDDRQLGVLEALGQEVTLRPRAMLVMQGHPAEAVFNVTAGVVRLYRLFPDGRCQVVGFALPGDFLGLPPDESYRFSADAAGPVAACRFGRRAFSRLVDGNPALLRRVYDSVNRQVDMARDHMMLLGRSTAEAKVASFLLDLGGRWTHIHGGSALVPLPMRRQDIGDFLGLSIATVSRMLTRFAREGLLLIVPSAVRILDFTRLAQIAKS